MLTTMSRPSRQPPVISPLPPALLRLLRARGRDVARIAARFSLPDDAENLDETAIEASATNDLIGAVAETLGEPFVALALPSLLTFQRYRFGELSARASATLRDGLTRLARYLPLIVPDLVADIEDGNGALRFRVRTPRHARGLGRHVHEYALAYMLAYARREASCELSVRAVAFAHARPRDIAPLYVHFGTRELVFGAEGSALVFAASDGDIALAGDDPRLLATIAPLAEGELGAIAMHARVTDRVANTVERLLPNPSIDAVADALHMSSRTLQRRMEQEGSQFSEIVDGVRAAFARRAIRDGGLAIGEIAARLGFADVATFGRAFKRWTGHSPGVFRRVT